MVDINIVGKKSRVCDSYRKGTLLYVGHTLNHWSHLDMTLWLGYNAEIISRW